MLSRSYNCAPELKLIFTSLLFFCAVATLFQFLPSQYSPFTTFVTLCPTTTTSSASAFDSPSPPPQQPSDRVLENGVVKRSFYPVGRAAYNFIFMSAYRGGPNTFVVLGLSSKPLQKFGTPAYSCEYQSTTGSSSRVEGYKLPLDDFGYGRFYVLVVVNCTFPQNNYPSTGGRLLLHASTNNGGNDRAVNSTDTIIALTEPPNSWKPSQFLSTLTPPKYDYLYCGSSLFGNLSPQRIREWIAYHVRLFGKKSHFVFYDAGGVHDDIMEVLQPWIELGFVTVHDVKDQERFDTFYHNQILVLNDCLHRHRFATKWMFFFDVDEYIYLSGNSSLDSVMELLNDYTMFNFEQVSMSDRLCLTQDAGHFHRKWGFEKLVYKDVKDIRRNQKYAIQPKNVYAAGVHRSDNFVGDFTWLSGDMMKYFHYHGTVAERQEPCRQLLSDNSTTMEDTPYVLDTTMRFMAPLIKKFELDTIGSRLISTRL